MSAGVVPRPIRRLERGVLVGRYVILGWLGEGGMGVVYKAYDPELERPVALKLLHAAGDPDGSSAAGRRERLFREAKALARLSHPHVLAIYDVGTFETDVFLATEFVEGTTLTDWQKEAPRTRAESLRVFLAAGEGLAAAHRAGLVHRDFKPANVMIGRDGRVRVLDFGVAHIEGGRRSRRPPPAVAPETTSSGGESETTLAPTIDGNVVGTPRYMSPEQHLGEAFSAKSDQFSFGVALYEALYGAPPFAGSGGTYIENLVTGRLASPPADANVPRWIRRILLQSIATEPSQRYPSMEALLAALADDPVIRRRRWGWRALAVAGGGLVIASALVVQRQRVGVCRGAEQRLAGVWDAPARDAVAASFARTGVPYAADAARTVTRALDDYARAWIDQRTVACEATRIRGEQSEELLDLRMQCLDERLTDLRERTAVFAHADRSTVEKAVESVHDLAPVTACSATAELRAQVRLPATAAARQGADEVRGHVARADALVGSARFQEASVEAKAAVDRARVLGYAPALAEALRVQGTVLERTGDYAGSATTYREAIAEAAAGHDEELAASAWIEMIRVIGERLAHYDEAERLLWVARADQGRLSDPGALPAKLLSLEGALDWRQGRYAQADTVLRQAILLLKARLGDRHPDAGKALGLLGIVLEAQGKPAEAEACHVEELSIMEEAFGAEHPSTIPALTHLADARGARGDHRAAVTLYERALRIDQESLGREHPIVGQIHNNLADELLALGDADEAIRHEEQAIAIWETSIGARHVNMGSGLYNLGIAYLMKGDGASALPPLQRSLDVFTATYGASHLVLMGDLLAIAQALDLVGRAAEARTFETRAIDLDARLPPAEREYERPVRVALGEALIRRGLAARAITTLEPALQENEGDAVTLAPARFALARALVAAGGDKARAESLARQALEAMRSAGPRDAKAAEAVARWLPPSRP